MEKWMIYALISMFFAGITSVIAKFGMKNLNSDTALAIRTIFVFAFVMLNAFLFRNIIPEIKASPKSNILFLGLSGLTTALSWIYYYRAIKIGPVAAVNTIDKASVLITIILSYIFLHEPITPKLVVASLLIFAGLLVMIWW